MQNPSLIQHGTCDNVVPCLQSKILAEALDFAIGSEKATFIPLEGEGHGGGPQFWAANNVTRL